MIAIPMTVSVSAVNIPVSVCSTDVLFNASIATAYNMREGEIYDGEYEFTPTEETQTALTNGKVLFRNITINPIPSNYGRITYNGSILTVS